MPWEKGGTSLLRPEGPREPGSVTCEMEGSRDLSGRNVFIVPPPRASASGLSPGLESPGPLGRRSRPPYESRQFRTAGWRKTLSPSTRSCLNRSIQIRAVPTSERLWKSCVKALRSLNPSIQIRAIPTRRSAGNCRARELQVSIPPYRSGQFRLVSALSRSRCRCRSLNPSIQIRAIPTFPGQLDSLLPAWPQESQSLHTDQGNSDDYVLHG